MDSELLYSASHLQEFQFGAENATYDGPLNFRYGLIIMCVLVGLIWLCCVEAMV